MPTFNFPAFNASLNGLAGIFLFLGWRAIKRGKRQTHQKLMIAALVASSVFLCSYLTYHFFIHGLTRYQGTGLLRLIYFTILLTHTPLAVVIVPFALIAVFHAHRQNFDKHTQITKWLLPVWLYVSVTGVIIYFMLYVF